MNGTGSREERERRGNDFVAAADVEGAHGEQDRGRAVRATDRILRMRQRSDVILQRHDCVAKNERLCVDNLHHGRNNVGANRRVLRFEV